ncbi:methyltransferase domain-containing protein [Halomarina ordinaria]|uniref:Methyltransferase domain-containing protein n=1 Tax=Halomarina ordinaria TaxID=3033939 RepID=A0ABD5UA18_9EURY|nr:methyltransferase domain-containing protein [Halomarina sp. PSRA2]
MYLFVRDGREYLLSPGETLESDLGILEVPEDVAPGDVVETHLGEAFEVRDLRGPDLFAHFERTGAPMMPRDIGLIMGHTGACEGDRVLDAGTGTGVLSAYLARAGAEVVTYERNPEFADVARSNMDLAGIGDRVEVRVGDVTDDLDADPDDLGTFDLLTLDTEDAPRVIRRAHELVVPGGYVTAYVPFVEGTRAAVEAAREAGLEDIETYETLQREMDFDSRGSRPSTAGVGHTGYLLFARA